LHESPGGCIEREIRFLFRSYPDSQFKRGFCTNRFFVAFNSSLLSSTGITFLKPVFNKFAIRFVYAGCLKSVADYINFLVDLSFIVKLFDDVNIIA
jgi:hypothetical protein